MGDPSASMIDDTSPRAGPTVIVLSPGSRFRGLFDHISQAIVAGPLTALAETGITWSPRYSALSAINGSVPLARRAGRKAAAAAARPRTSTAAPMGAGSVK